MDNILNIASSNDVTAGPPSSASDAFGCCSRYRACSAKKSCLIPDLDYAKNCSYRKSLESGIIFYGKSALDFSDDEYTNYLNRADHLDNEVRTLFYSILVNFLYYDCYTPSICMYHSNTLQILSDLELISVEPSNRYILEHYKNNALEDVLKGFPELWSIWKVEKAKEKQQAKESKKVFVLRNIIIPWMKNNAPEAVEAIASKYRLVSIPDSTRRYAIELYYEKCAGHESTYYLDLPRESDPSFFTTRG